MDQVEKWLEGLGFPEFASTFARYKIDLGSLGLLSERDLQEMHIPLGPRKKLIAAIDELRQADRSQRSKGSTDRRQVTVLFCDLVGSTEYAVRLDPEDSGELTQRYLEQCGNVVRNNNGRVITSIGDAILALFGYPVAEEDDADRALNASLDILKVTSNINVSGGLPVQVRIGIASGLAVVGTTLGTAESPSTFAFGPVPNLAQRLQALAVPQTILVDEHTYTATAGAFEFTELGFHSLKGFSEPQRVWRVEQPRLLQNRFARRTTLFRFVGRESQLSTTVKLWDEAACTGRGRAVIVTGEPGIGKSRLASEVQKNLSECTQLVLQCVPAFSNTVLMPFLGLIKRHTDIQDREPTSSVLRKLEHALATSGVPVSLSLPIFARLLSIRVELPHMELSSVRQQEISRRVLVDWIQYQASIRPVLVLFEDAQWSDPSSRDVLNTLIAEASAHRMLILVTTRGPSERPWPEGGHITEMELARLTHEESQDLLESVAAGSCMSEELRKQVLQRGEGVPLFIEELTRSAIETGFPVDLWDQEERKSGSGVPRSLQLSLVSRLDKLGAAKAVAQVAAVIGREFDVELLAHICNTRVSALKQTMDQLTHSGLVAPQLSASRTQYAFTHALLQEAARSTLLRERRQELHGLIAHAIERLDPKTAAEHPELLAQHFADAGMFGRAAECWLAAGLNVAKTWAKVEAANMFSMGLACLERLPGSVERSRKALRLELEKGDVLYAAFGHITPEGRAAYENAMRLSHDLGDSDAPIRALDGLFGIAFNSAQFVDAEWASDQLIEIGTKGQSLKALVLGLQFKGMSLFSGGKFQRARRFLEQSLRYENEADLVGSDFPSMAMLYLSWTLHIMGHPQRARRLYDRAESITRKQSAYRLAACLGNGCVLLALQSKPGRIKQAVRELIQLARDNGFKLWLNMGHFFEGWAMAKLDGDVSGLEKMQGVCDSLGDQEVDKSCYLALLADAYVYVNELGRATLAVDQGLTHVQNTGERYFAAELIRLSGQVQLQLKGDVRQAEALFREAIELSREQRAKLWEKKASTSLESLLESVGESPGKKLRKRTSAI